MDDKITITIGEDDVARLYDDTYDVTIHCENEEEQKKSHGADGYCLEAGQVRKVRKYTQTGRIYNLVYGARIS